MIGDRKFIKFCIMVTFGNLTEHDLRDNLKDG